MASHAVVASQKTVKPSVLSAIAASRTFGGARRSSSRTPASRPRNIPPTIAASAAAATPGDTFAWLRSSSPAHRFRQTSTEPVATMLVQANQYAGGSRPPPVPCSARTTTAVRCASRENQPNSASAATARTTAARPGRQPNPAATAPPMISGLTVPTPAATAFASLIAAAPAGPWCPDSVATTPLTSSEPARAATNVAAIVAGNGRAAHRPRTPTAMPTTPPHITRGRPYRRTSHGNAAPPTRAATASAEPCRLATARLVPCSSRSRGTTGPNP
jgi:hypothetical protein